MASGLTRSTPAITPSMPTAISAKSIPDAEPVLLPTARHAAPPTRHTIASSEDRCRAGRCGGRPESASTVGIRAIVRPGHQAAAVAAATASNMAATTSHQGTLNASNRCPTALPTLGASANHPSKPSTVPITAATTPVAAPVASIVSRRCFSVAPTADIIPS